MVDEARQRIEVVDEAAIEFEQAVWAMVSAQREAMEEVYRRLCTLERMVEDCRYDDVGYRECARIMNASLGRAVLAMKENAAYASFDEVVSLGKRLGFICGCLSIDMKGKGKGND